MRGGGKTGLGVDGIVVHHGGTTLPVKRAISCTIERERVVGCVNITLRGRTWTDDVDGQGYACEGEGGRVGEVCVVPCVVIHSSRVRLRQAEGA